MLPFDRTLSQVVWQDRGIALLPPDFTKERIDVWVLGLKERLGGIKLLVNKKMLWREGPPGFSIVYGTNEAWRVAWKPYEDEDLNARAEWSKTLPLTLEDAINAGAVDLR